MARELTVSVNHVRLVLHGERRSPKVEAAISGVLGIGVDVAFPPPPARRRRLAGAA